MRAVVVTTLVVLSLLGSGCSVVLKDSLQGPVADCVGESDGTPCSAADYCLEEVCVYSTCGDTFVDRSRGEACDDGNLVASDGCEPGRCRFSCTRDEQCVSADPCNESGGCDTTTHTCRQSNPSSGASCTREDSSLGICRSGLCASADCGNGQVDAGEDCDSDAAGCRTDCQWVCDAASSCTTTDLCAMPVVCDETTHVCVNEPSPECGDTDTCTVDSCDALTGCSSTLIDADGDGYSPYECKPGSVHLGGDCDDSNLDRHPGAQEMLNSIDEDCDETIDENPGVTCLHDVDLDGYGDPNDTKIAQSCTAGWVTSRARNDCNDANAAVNPGITTASSVPYCVTGSLAGSESNGYSCTDGSSVSWDWNCDGTDSGEIPMVLASCSNLYACGGTYWANAVPACGTRGTLRNCASSCVLVLCSCAATDSPNVLQRCL